MTPFAHLLLDLDGTLIVDQKDAGRDPSRVALLPGVGEGLRQFRDAGAHFFVVTNQGGIGLSLYTEADFLSCLHRTRNLLTQEDITLKAIEFCPHAPEAHCACRKPATGMWESLRLKFPQLHARNTVMIGDKDRDVLLGRAIGCPTVRIRCADYPDTVDADIVVNDFPQLAQRLLKAQDRVMSSADVALFAARMRKDGKTIVTTNGAFDLLHAGHRFLFAEARKHGDILIVGVNSDASVRRQKGEDRPAESQDVRAHAVARYSDAVFVFDDPDPRPWLPLVCPDVHLNASSYGEDCVEAPVLREIGAKLVLVPVRPDLGSTTAILRSAS